MVSKAPHVLLTAFRDLPAGAVSVDLVGAYCAYHGDDSYRQQIAPLLDQPGVHGASNRSRTIRSPGFWDRSMCSSCPSIWPENSPLVIREAFLAGVPVVASRIGGIPEIVTDGRNGLLFRAGDVTDLARVLTRLLQEPSCSRRSGPHIPAVRTIEDDVSCAREANQECDVCRGARGATGAKVRGASSAKVKREWRRLC